MKRYLLFFIISILALVSCVKQESVYQPEEKSGIVLDIVCSTLNPITKANDKKHGVPALNENVIKTIDYFFYPTGKTDEPSVLHGRETVDNVEDEYSINVGLNEALLNNILFPKTSTSSIDDCEVAVLVNYTGDHPSDNNTRLVDIQNLPLTLQLTSSGKGKNQSEFVMFGTKQVTLTSRRENIVAHAVVDVHRVACKITLDAHIPDYIINKVEYVDNTGTYTLEEKWIPLISQMYIYLENGVSNAVVSGDQEETKPYSYFEYSSDTPFTGEMATHNITKYTYSEGNPDADPPVPPQITGTETTPAQFHVSPPFYSYPQSWVVNDPKEPFLKLVLPWTREQGHDNYGHSWGPTQRSFYYRIILPVEATGFVSNNWYHINLDVAILGSDTDGAPVKIDGKYYVVDWGAGIPVTTDIKGSRYLSVQQTSYTMYNTNNLSIPYITSNNCSLERITIKQRDYSGTTASDHYYYNNATSCPWVYLQEIDNKYYIIINKELNNDLSSANVDVAPYEYSFRIRHADSEGATYFKDITVKQYPAMYIYSERSNGYRYVNGVSTEDYDIYDDSGTRDQYHYMGRIAAINSGAQDNRNPNQYTIYVSVLPNNSEHSIGDPRKSTSDNLGAGISGLNNYRPTADDTKNIIAPVFKIASSYGKTRYLTYEGAQKRCATYQENGYPAGRWRLPTAAEIDYIMTLSAKGKIPTLFNPEQDDTDGYWAGGYQIRAYSGFKDATGITPNNRQYNIDGVRDFVVYARCVYDVWYWGDDKVSPADRWAGYSN